MRGFTATNGEPSLAEAFRSVPVDRKAKAWRKLFAFVGPGYMVSVGYMDPGNWATDLAGGSKYGFALLWVILLSNLMAMLLQSLCVKLGIATGKDLAQACRAYYKKPVALVLWFLCEIAIIACEIAEVIGSAIAIMLLTGGRIPLVWGVLITAADVLLLLALMKYGFRKLEAVVFALVFTVGACFALQMFLAKPDMGAVGAGLVGFQLPDKEALLIALGILGATVMPHNLYLHSSIIQTRAVEPTPEGKREAIRFGIIDVVLALGAAFFVNAAILVLAGTVFHGGQVVEELEQAHQLLSPLLGGASATAFAIALLASGQSATITGTLAGQIVMEGFLRIRVKPWVRRLVTRLLAVVPAIILISLSGGKDTVHLLVLSQVVLSMQLSFAIFPLLLFTSDRRKMGEFVNPAWLTALGSIVCLLIAGLNIYLLFDALHPILFWSLVAVGLAFTAWVTFFYRESAEESAAREGQASLAQEPV